MGRRADFRRTIGTLSRKSPNARLYQEGDQEFPSGEVLIHAALSAPRPTTVTLPGPIETAPGSALKLPPSDPQDDQVTPPSVDWMRHRALSAPLATTNRCPDPIE